MAGKVLELGSRARTSTPKKAKRKAATINREGVLLWQFSQVVDEAITHAILEKGSKPEEVAAILAHRLGTLIDSTERADALKEFCIQLLQKLSPDRKDPHSSAS